MFTLRGLALSPGAAVNKRCFQVLCAANGEYLAPEGWVPGIKSGKSLGRKRRGLSCSAGTKKSRMHRTKQVATTMLPADQKSHANQPALAVYTQHPCSFLVCFYTSPGFPRAHPCSPDGCHIRSSPFWRFSRCLEVPCRKCQRSSRCCRGCCSNSLVRPSAICFCCSSGCGSQ